LDDALRLLLPSKSEFFPAGLGRLPVPIESLADIQVVITGRGLDAIKGLLENQSVVYGAALFDSIVRRVVIAARCQPLHKSTLVLLFMESCDYTAFIGDGANDTAALKAADIGLSLSDVTNNAEASVAAPFTSADMDISSIVTLLLEGRAALANNFALFRFMALYAYIQFCNSVQQMLIGSYVGEWQFIYVDLLLVLPLSFAAPMTASFHELTSRRVASSLLNWQILASIIGHAIICLGFQIAARNFVFNQCWYQPYGYQLCPEAADTVSMVTTAISNATLLGLPESSFDVDAISTVVTDALTSLNKIAFDGFVPVFNESIMTTSPNMTAEAADAVITAVLVTLIDQFNASFSYRPEGCNDLGCQLILGPPPNCQGFVGVSAETCTDPQNGFTGVTPAFQGSALWLMCNFQYLFMIVTFAAGPPFRKPFYTNLAFVVIFVILFVCTCLILLLAGGWVETFFELVGFPAEGQFKWKLFGLCLCSGATSFLYEFCIARLDAYLSRDTEAEANGRPKRPNAHSKVPRRSATFVARRCMREAYVNERASRLFACGTCRWG
jgi:soluble P-type ATPase